MAVRFAFENGSPSKQLYFKHRFCLKHCKNYKQCESNGYTSELLTRSTIKKSIEDAEESAVAKPFLTHQTKHINELYNSIDAGMFDLIKNTISYKDYRMLLLLQDTINLQKSKRLKNG